MTDDELLWEDIAPLVIKEFCDEQEDGRFDERPLDAASAMYINGMTWPEIQRAMVQVWNSALDNGSSDSWQRSLTLHELADAVRGEFPNPNPLASIFKPYLGEEIARFIERY